MSCVYTTGTFDMIHKGHIEFLKACKQITRGKTLIIGLTTDELACRQKRQPIMNYEQRRSILVEFPFVDLVVPHNGEPKHVAQKRLHFTDMAIGVEYEGALEYILPGVRVHFIPCPLNRALSSTQLTKQLDANISSRFDILSTGGPSGNVMVYNGFCQSFAFKTIRVSHSEYGSTSNVYNLPVPNPRNWKHVGEQHVFPNIQGVNAMREIEIQKILREFDWNPVLNIREHPVHDTSSQPYPIQTDYSHLNYDRLHNPRSIYVVRMKYAGLTLENWIEQGRTNIVDELNIIIRKVRNICAQLKQSQVIHGDLHERNICIEPIYEPQMVVGERTIIDWKVTIIDFGWCLSPIFDLDAHEREYLQTCLDTDWDFKHFKNAMEYKYTHYGWLSLLNFDDNLPISSP